MNMTKKPYCNSFHLLKNILFAPQLKTDYALAKLAKQIKRKQGENSLIFFTFYLNLVNYIFLTQFLSSIFTGYRTAGKARHRYDIAKHFNKKCGKMTGIL